MTKHAFFPVPSSDAIVTCPNCGGDHYESNHLAEALYREAAREVPMLLFDGRRDEALEVLTALYAIRIVNHLRPPHRCLSCGGQFDA